MAKSAKKLTRRYCKVCKKKTRHVRPFATMPLECVNRHPDDNIRCVVCHRPFSKEIKKKAAALGAKMRRCHLCMDFPIDICDWLRLCVHKIAIRHHGE